MIYFNNRKVHCCKSVLLLSNNHKEERKDCPSDLARVGMGSGYELITITVTEKRSKAEETTGMLLY